MGIFQMGSDAIRKRLNAREKVENLPPNLQKVEEENSAKKHITQIINTVGEAVKVATKTEAVKPETREEESAASLEMTLEALKSLEKLNTQLVDKYKYSDEADIKLESEENGEKQKHSFYSFGAEGSKYFRQDAEGAAGQKRKMVFSITYHRPHVPKDTRESSLTIDVTKKNGHSIAYEFRFLPRLKISNVVVDKRDHTVFGMKMDGLHVRSLQQLEWIRKWTDFLHSLRTDKVFAKSLSKIGEEEPLKIMERSFVFDEFKDFNPIKAVNDLEEYWNSAYANHSRFTKKKFPREMAPLNLGECPPDEVIPHDILIRTINSATERLSQTVQAIEEGQKEKSDHPYR